MPTSNPLALISSDNHLQRGAWANRGSLYGDSIYSFRQIVDCAQRLSVPLILAGDVLDKQLNDAYVIRWLHRCMRAMEKSGLDVFYIQGQHELQLETRWLSAVSEHTTKLDGGNPIPLRGGHAMEGIDWTSRDKLQERLDAVDSDTNILVMHQTFDRFMGDYIATELQQTMIPAQVELLIIGDFHDKPGMITGRRADGSEYRILCPGSTAMQSITEPVQKMAWVLYDDLSVRPEVLNTRALIKLNAVWDSDDLELVCQEWPEKLAAVLRYADSAELPEWIRKPMAYISVNEDYPEGYKELKRVIGDDGHLFYKKLENPLKRKVQRVGVIEGARNMSQQERFLRALEITVPRESPVYDFSAKLLLAPDKHEALKELREAHFAAYEIDP